MHVVAVPHCPLASHFCACVLLVHRVASGAQAPPSLLEPLPELELLLPTPLDDPPAPPLDEEPDSIGADPASGAVAFPASPSGWGAASSSLRPESPADGSVTENAPPLHEQRRRRRDRIAVFRGVDLSF